MVVKTIQFLPGMPWTVIMSCRHGLVQMYPIQGYPKYKVRILKNYHKTKKVRNYPFLTYASR